MWQWSRWRSHSASVRTLLHAIHVTLGSPCSTHFYKVHNWPGKTLREFLRGRKWVGCRSPEKLGREQVLRLPQRPLPSLGEPVRARLQWGVRPETLAYSMGPLKCCIPREVMSYTTHRRGTARKPICLSLSWVEGNVSSPPLSCGLRTLVHSTSWAKKHQAEDL